MFSEMQFACPLNEQIFKLFSLFVGFVDIGSSGVGGDADGCVESLLLSRWYGFESENVDSETAEIWMAQ